MKKRLDQDINFILKGIELRLWLDTTYPGPGDRFLIVPKEPEKPSVISSVLKELYKKLIPKGSYFWPRVTDDYLEIVVDIEDDRTGITRGIFTSLPDWNGNDFNFAGAIELIRFLNDLKEVLKEVDPEVEFLRGDGKKIKVPARIKP